jgi:hypothetical protein
MATHEDLSREDAVSVGSDRNFGIVFTAFCSLVALAQFWFGGRAAWGWLAAAVLFAAFTVVYARALRPLNVLWFKFGMLLHRVMSPVILGILFYAVFTPVGWCMRLSGRRPLGLAFDRGAKSYWVHRAPPAPPPGSFDNQF